MDWMWIDDDEDGKTLRSEEVTVGYEHEADEKARKQWVILEPSEAPSKGEGQAQTAPRKASQEEDGTAYEEVPDEVGLKPGATELYYQPLTSAPTTSAAEIIQQVVAAENLNAESNPFNDTDVSAQLATDETIALILQSEEDAAARASAHTLPRALPPAASSAASSSASSSVPSTSTSSSPTPTPSESKEPAPLPPYESYFIPTLSFSTNHHLTTCNELVCKLCGSSLKSSLKTLAPCGAPISSGMCLKCAEKDIGTSFALLQRTNPMFPSASHLFHAPCLL
eukprot:GILI01013128.1.p1 GENE.GILI01013128.1~~GILI01013128.1.p1  ORF type:complete len:282 (-),score=84.45 GILI01013128.1:252-1097(-)